MAFTIQNWGRVSTTANEPITTLQDTSVIGTPRVYSYVSADTQATIDDSGYFNAAVANGGVAPDLVTGDLIMVRSTTDGTTVFYDVTNTAGVITVTAFSGATPIGTADITNLAVTTAKIDNLAVTTGKIAANAVDSSKLALTTLQYATVAITAAEFNGMYAAPKLLVAAPGANKLIVLDKVDLLMTYGAAAFAAGGVAAVQYDSTANGAGVIASSTLAAATFQAAASTGFMFNTGVVAQTFSTCVNKGLYLSNITGAFTTGDSTFVAHVWYKVVATV